jgi:hypothetical protein
MPTELRFEGSTEAREIVREFGWYQRRWLVRDACVGERHMWATLDCYLR